MYNNSIQMMSWILHTASLCTKGNMIIEGEIICVFWHVFQPEAAACCIGLFEFQVAVKNDLVQCVVYVAASN